jgi:hypothetical protein
MCLNNAGTRFVLLVAGDSALSGSPDPARTASSDAARFASIQLHNARISSEGEPNEVMVTGFRLHDAGRDIALGSVSGHA